METKPDAPSETTSGEPFTPIESQTPETPSTLTQEIKDLQDSKPKSEEKQIFLNGRRFSSVEELASYTAKVEKEKSDLERKSSQPKETKAKKNYFDSFVEDPDNFVADLEQNITQKIEQKYVAQETEKQVWNKFYTEYPDLKGYEDLVDLSKARVWDRVRDIPITDGLAEIAKVTRQRLSGIRGKAFDGTKELASGQAMATPVGSAPSSKVAVKVENTDFVSQLRALQKRNRG